MVSINCQQTTSAETDRLDHGIGDGCIQVGQPQTPATLLAVTPGVECSLTVGPLAQSTLFAAAVLR